MISLDSMKQTIAKESSISAREGGISFVYHKNGKRIVISKRILEIMNHPQKIAVGLLNDYLILLPDDENGYSLKTIGKQSVIYNSALIKEILDYFNIDYSKNICMTFSELEKVDGNNMAVAIRMVA